jgi:hypothetical protein
MNDDKDKVEEDFEEDKATMTRKRMMKTLMIMMTMIMMMEIKLMKQLG